MYKLIFLSFITLFSINIESSWQMISQIPSKTPTLHGYDKDILDDRLNKLRQLKTIHKQEIEIERKFDLDPTIAIDIFKFNRGGQNQELLAKAQKENELIKKIKILDPDSPYNKLVPRDAYQKLGVNRFVSDKEIRSAYEQYKKNNIDLVVNTSIPCKDFEKPLRDLFNNISLICEHRNLQISYENLVQFVDKYDADLKNKTVRKETNYFGSVKETRLTWEERKHSHVIPTLSEGVIIFKKNNPHFSEEQVDAAMQMLYSKAFIYNTKYLQNILEKYKSKFE